MKIFSLRNLLGIGAIYAATQYAKKNGGARNALEGLITKVKQAANVKRDELIGKAHDASVDSKSAGSAYDTGSYSGGGYSSGVGGNGTTRRS